MIQQRTDACSLDELIENTSEIVRDLAATGEPMILCIDGQPRLVVQDLDAYQRTLDLLDRLEAIDGIRRGLESARRGEGRPAQEVFDEMRAKAASAIR